MAPYSSKEAAQRLAMTTMYVWHVDKTRGNASARQHERIRQKTKACWTKEEQHFKFLE